MAQLKTSLCRLLNIDLPLIQAPIGGASCPALAAAVSNAGALGMIAASWRSPKTIRRMADEIRALTTKPFGMNLVLQWPQHERLDAMLDAGVRVVSFFWGDPSPYIAKVHAAGGVVLHTVASAAEARRAVAAEADAIIAQGWEAGGHVWGEVSTISLVPRVLDAVSPVPVVAAGGIADGRGIAAALVLGAAGAWVGTRFVASEEANAHAIYKQKIIDAVETDTAYLTLFDVGWENAPHRALRNSTIELWEAAGRPAKGNRPGEGEVIASGPEGQPLVRYGGAAPTARVSGSVEALALYAGQGVGLVRRVQPAREIVEELMRETAAALSGADA